MRPFIFVNIAASIDGKISNEDRVQLRISSPKDLERVDKLRASADAIMVGIGTVLSDNPSLTVKSRELREERRRQGKDENPIRVVTDSKCKIQINAKVLDSQAKTIIAVSKSASKNRIREVSERAEIVVFGDDLVDLKSLMEYLYLKGVKTIMVEGGGTLISSLLREKLIDEIYIYYGPIIIGGSKAPTICNGQSFNPPIKVELLSVERMDRGLLTKWRVRYLTSQG
ncbi:2,5-diamino-6-(ribosylamino)-4(3H)-pyrimidinone 5'-phosphate reductase [Archaeoglobales archaeon]|nr:MAG: 2,5-diamino-6-(ribosylamino)-4(3H)-pyrimidinone 5'-phosphate reductase [Archaeoglobales archaeon]